MSVSRPRTLARVSLTTCWPLACILVVSTIWPSDGRGQTSPGGQVVNTEWANLFIDCRGEGSPTVVFEAGVGAWSAAWRHVRDRVAEQTRACVYDRAGYGSSGPGSGPRDVESIATELHMLLAAQERSPFVLVGHSFGGWVTRVYAHRYPDQVAGLVLIESAHEHQWGRLPPTIRELYDASLPGMVARADSARAGQLEVESVLPHRFYSSRAPLWSEYRQEMIDPDHHQTVVDEVRSMDRSAGQVARTGPLGDLPLGVVSSAREFDAYRGTPIPIAEANRIWLELQDELAGLSGNMVHVVSKTGTHTLQFEEPELLAGVVLEVVARARAH